MLGYIAQGDMEAFTQAKTEACGFFGTPRRNPNPNPNRITHCCLNLRRGMRGAKDPKEDQKEAMC